jgi:hypothetical protein
MQGDRCCRVEYSLQEATMGNSWGDYVEETSDWGQKMLDVKGRVVGGSVLESGKVMHQEDVM